MKTVGLIFPHQLFLQHPVLKRCNEVFLIEDSLFFGDRHNPMKFHKQKLVFHRASMKYFADHLHSEGFAVHYVEYNADKTINDILDSITADSFVVVDPTDYLLSRRLKRESRPVTTLESPLFINSRNDNQEYLNEGKLFMHEFYKWQRKRLNILMDAEGPTGGRWSFDDENRKKIPKAHYPQIPSEPAPTNNEYVEEAIEYVESKFSDNYGSLDTYSYVVTHTEVEEKLHEFCKERLHFFGDCEDAIVAERSMLYHSTLSPYLNVGLLTPMQVVSTVLEYAESNAIPINNTEGIIRQIIGWREFIRMVYEEHGTSMRTQNQWDHVRELGPGWYDGTTGLDPVDITISKTLKHAYAHHIERLMVLGNAMFLCRIHPDDIYRWFMELYIDAYDWVMVPNVYGMTQSTQKGLMTTKPYISGSNYLKKMSDYKNGPWTEIWNSLYWSFIIDHLDELTANGRMHFVTSRASKFTDEQKQHYYHVAKTFLETL